MYMYIGDKANLQPTTARRIEPRYIYIIYIYIISIIIQTRCMKRGVFTIFFNITVRKKEFGFILYYVLHI